LKTRFAKRRKLFNIFFILNLSIIIAVIIGAVILGYNIFTNPECVGEFFGRIMKGFSGVPVALGITFGRLYEGIFKIRYMEELIKLREFCFTEKEKAYQK
jgi:hypothetical protein